MNDLSIREGRQEVKFVARDTTFHQLVQWTRLHPAGFRQKYPPRQINSLYFDAPGFDSYSESVAGVSARAKVRYRWYGASAFPCSGQLEVKVKRGQTGWKLVWPVDVATSPDAVTVGNLRRLILERLPGEAQHWLLEFSEPVLRNRYTRHYWEALFGDLRLTMDTDLAMFSLQRSFSRDLDRTTRINRTVIVELKFNNANRRKVADMIKGMPLVMSRNSKYCNGLSQIYDA